LRIYITHCSAKKDDSLRRTGERVSPDRLYTSQRIQRFMNVCKERCVHWAILSDLYGVWFPTREHEWYDKPPNSVTEQEFRMLLSDFDNQLRNYAEIWFYYNPSRFHPIYRKLLDQSRLKQKVKRFTHITDILRRENR